MCNLHILQLNAYRIGVKSRPQKNNNIHVPIGVKWDIFFMKNRKNTGKIRKKLRQNLKNKPP